MACRARVLVGSYQAPKGSNVVLLGVVHYNLHTKKTVTTKNKTLPETLGRTGGGNAFEAYEPYFFVTHGPDCSAKLVFWIPADWLGHKACA